MRHDKRRPCARCGREVAVNSARPVAVFVCADCRRSDPWYVEKAIHGDQRLRTSALKRREADKCATDLVEVLRSLARWQVFARLNHPVELDVCSACGSLERADRACQVCQARRVVAA